MKRLTHENFHVSTPVTFGVGTIHILVLMTTHKLILK